MTLRKLSDSYVEMLAELYRNDRLLWNVTFSQKFKCGQAEGGTVQDKSSEAWRGYMYNCNPNRTVLQTLH